jgi:transpeptidase family protein
VKRSVFLISILLSHPFLVFAGTELVPSGVEGTAPSETNFYQQVFHEVEKTLRKRDGVVLWIDKNGGSAPQKVFGDGSLAERFFPPGSIMKLITAETALGRGDDWKYHCTGHDRIGGRNMFCWKRNGHGEMNLPQALSRSCNLFFASLGESLGPEALRPVLEKYGFSMASSPSLKKMPPGEWGAFAIGDSPFFKVTPGEVASFWGRYLEQLDEPSFSGIRQGLRRTSTEGTASQGMRSTFEILAKTGTSDSGLSSFRTDGWFLGAYPSDHPRFAVVVFVRNAYGFREASQLGKTIFFLARKTGVME